MVLVRWTRVHHRSLNGLVEDMACTHLSLMLTFYIHAHYYVADHTLAHPSMPDNMFTAPRIASRSSDTFRTSRPPLPADSPNPSRSCTVPPPGSRSRGPGDASLRIASSAVRAAPRAILRPLSLSANAEFSRSSLISRTERWVPISPSLAS